MTREFTATEAVRLNANLLLGLSAPSGGGKTWTALELAHGIQQVSGGDIYVGDSDNGRALHYAGAKTKADTVFKFKHVPIAAPHDSLTYRDFLRFCEKNKAGVIVLDTLSKEHDGEGGMLEQHEAELDRMAGDNFRKREAVQLLAWAKPKGMRRKLIQAIQELDTHAIFTFRARQTVKPMKIGGKTEIVPQGFVPIAGDEFVYEMTLNALLYPHAGGVATWDSEYVGEKLMIKLPDQFSRLRDRTEPMNEELGKQLAQWAKGGVPKPRTAPPKPEEAQEPGPQSGAASGATQAAGGGAQPSTEEDRTSGPKPGQTAQPNVSPSEADETPWADYALAVAEANDWPGIRQAMIELRASSAWSTATPDQLVGVRRIAWARLQELLSSGYEFDFLDDLHAYRCYIDHAPSAQALDMYQASMAEKPVWLALDERGRAVFLSAIKARVIALAQAEGVEQ